MIQIKREVSIFLCAFSQQVYRGPKKGEHQKILTPLLQYIHYTLRQIYQGSIICPVGLSSAVKISHWNFQTSYPLYPFKSNSFHLTYFRLGHWDATHQTGLLQSSETRGLPARSLHSTDYIVYSCVSL